MLSSEGYDEQEGNEARSQIQDQEAYVLQASNHLQPIDIVEPKQQLIEQIILQKLKRRKLEEHERETKE